MLGFTTNQLAILFLALVLGWLLGLLSRSGGKKWRLAYEAERDARIEEQRDHAAAIETANARIAELERAHPAVRPVALPATATPATLDLTRDDLSRISGIGAAGEARLNEEGLYRYADLADMTAGEESALEAKLGADPGYISQERWREQAAMLRDGNADEHRATFG